MLDSHFHDSSGPELSRKWLSGTIPNFANEKEPKGNLLSRGKNPNTVTLTSLMSLLCKWSWYETMLTGWCEDDLLCLTCVPSLKARVTSLMVAAWKWKWWRKWIDLTLVQLSVNDHFVPFQCYVWKLGWRSFLDALASLEVTLSVSQWAIDIFSIAVRTSHKKYQNFARILSFWSNL